MSAPLGDDNTEPGGAVTWLAPDPDVAPRVVEQLRDRGYTTCEPPLPGEPWDLSARRLVMATVVRAPADVADTVLAAARGVTIVITIDAAYAAAEPIEGDALLDTLARLGPLRLWTGDDPAAGRHEPPPANDGGLGDEHRRLLDLLAGGASLAEAATTLYVSLRTANRRLSEARSALGATSNRAAVLAWNQRRRS